MFIERETVADAFGPKEDCVEEVFISRIAVAEGLARVEEERNIHVFLFAVFAEPEYLR